MNPQHFCSHLENLYNKAGVSATPSALKARFIAGLNYDIQHQLEVLPLKDLSDVVHTAMTLFEQKLRVPYGKYRRSGQDTNRSSLPSAKTGSQEKEVKERSQPSRDPKATLTPTTKQPVPSDRTRDVECYKCGGRGHLKRDCPNVKKVYFSSLKHDYESQDDSDAESNPSSDETDLACGPDLADNVPKLNFVAWRALSVKMSPNDQRE